MTDGIGRVTIDFGAEKSAWGGEFAACEGLEWRDGGLTLERGACSGMLESAPVEVPPFDWLVPWWQAETAGSGYVEFQVAVGSSAGTWSHWYRMGRWSAEPGSFSGAESVIAGRVGYPAAGEANNPGDVVVPSGDPEPREVPAGAVETDTLVLTGKAARFRYRISMGAAGDAADEVAASALAAAAPGAGKSPAGAAGDAARQPESPTAGRKSIPGAALLRTVGFVTRDRAAPRPGAVLAELPESDIAVPSRSQMAEHADIRGRICSPTCCAMALERIGLRYPTEFVAAACLDHGAEIYGNWPFNVAALGGLGASARLDFFPGIAAAAAELALGHVLIASIRYKEGELPGAAVKATSGHLVLVRGVRRSPGGVVVLVNDPAAPDPSSVPREYPLEPFLAAWRGVAYVVEGRREIGRQWG